MIKHGKPPYLECSTAGDRRFSAFCAVVRGRTIEDWYQGAKVFADGSTGLRWLAAKGRRPVNLVETRVLYRKLWDEYIESHPELQEVLISASGLSDRYGQAGHVCQATELWRIRTKLSMAS